MKKILLITLVLINLFLTGCWDMIEINQRKFPYSVGIDLNTDGGKKYIITFSSPNINAIGKNANQQNRLRISSIEANSIFTAEKRMFKKIQNPIYTKHLKVLVISQDVGKNKEDMKEIVDGFNRDFEINKTVEMCLVKNSVKDFLHSIPKAETQEEVEGTLYRLLTNNQRSSAFTSKTVMEFINDHDIKKSSIIPVGRIEDDEYIFEGGAVFEDYKLIGYIDSEISDGLAFLLNTTKEDEVNMIYNGVNISINIINRNLKKELKDKENLSIVYNIEVECHLQEYTIGDKKDIDDARELKKIEEQINREIESIINNAIKKLQKDFKIDYIGVCEYLQKFHPEVWREVKDDWHNIFPGIDIEVNIDSRIRRRGLSK